MGRSQDRQVDDPVLLGAEELPERISQKDKELWLRVYC
jgi:hypothetical protein